MKPILKSLQVQTKTNDVDEQGRVTVAVNGIGIEDSQGDISMPGSFDQTLREDLSRMKWLYNHDTTQLLGVPLEGAEKDGNLVMVGQLNMKKELCRDVYADYKLMAEYGRTLEHSVGVIALKRDSADRRKVKQWKMLEYSTLSFLGANPQTFLVDIKSATPSQVRDAVGLLRKALTQPEYSDNKLKHLDMELSLLLKKLNGGRIVTCPHCGYTFDYDEYPEHTFTDEVLDNAREFAEWIISDTVYEHIQDMEPEIQAQVSEIMDAIRSKDGGISTKSIDTIMSYVRCPCCWGKVYATDIDAEAQEQPEEQPVTEEGKSDEGDGDCEDDREKPEEKSFGAFLSGLTKKL